MEPAHRAALRRLRLELSGQLLVSDSIVPLLYQEEVLSEAHVQDIERQPTERLKSLRLLDLLPHRGPRAFPVFLRALRDFSWLRDRLLQELQELQAWSCWLTLSSLPDVCRLPDSVLRRVPSDRELSRLASQLGAEWEAVLMDLGLSAETVFRCRADHGLSTQAAALAGLVRWRRAGGRDATLGTLLRSLEAADVHPSILEDALG
ncbi:death domain-containing protein CRADD [Cololabis saira]|uniref:death domain-containing protein CRADD n=1 Tax=Cololabis saira TaxID=129043 RepID=UPI002AD317E2|nr:death domain-containing protein CRADD [Cololabis saira]